MLPMAHLRCHESNDKPGRMDPLDSRDYSVNDVIGDLGRHGVGDIVCLWHK